MSSACADISYYLSSHVTIRRGRRGAGGWRRARPAPPATLAAPSSAPPPPSLAGRIRAASRWEEQEHESCLAIPSSDISCPFLSTFASVRQGGAPTQTENSHMNCARRGA